MPVSYQQATSPYITQNMTFGDEKMRIDQTKPKIKSQILSNLFNEKYGLRLGEFKNTTGTERVKVQPMCLQYQGGYWQKAYLHRCFWLAKNFNSGSFV